LEPTAYANALGALRKH